MAPTKRGELDDTKEITERVRNALLHLIKARNEHYFAESQEEQSDNKGDESGKERDRSP